jgi:hydroxymethylpyrimidine pyrophosphatase-like HAD family hydrolase
MASAARAPVRAVFSDLDGTLVHFSQWFGKHGVRVIDGSVGGDPTRAVVENDTGERRACRVLPESTMGPGYVSERTIELVGELRERGTLFVVITAARKSTLLERLPFLPPCDVAVCECGSRIYYGDQLDTEWASRFEAISGPLETDVPVEQRPQPLWQLCRKMRDAGLRVDTRSYYGCFRVSASSPHEAEQLEGFRNSLNPTQIACTMNLGKYDFYPAACGKGNAVKYLQAKFGVRKAESAALFDDDNDLPMAAECALQLLPALTSDSIVEAVRAHPEWQVAKRCGQGVFAVEELIESVLALPVGGAAAAADRAAESESEGAATR